MRVASATIVSVQAHTEDGLNNTYLFFLAPEGTEDVSFTLVANAACASGGMIRAVRSPLRSRSVFLRYFYKPQPLRTLEKIRADILALERDQGVVG